MSYNWILKSGQCDLADAKKLLFELSQQDCFFIAMYTNRFEAGRLEELKIDCICDNLLLELRAFNKDKELLITRGCIGEEFSWRIAADNELEKEEYYDVEHFIDINTEKSTEYAEDGNLIIMSTVGGKYSLPIKKGTSKVKIRNYIDYDSNGMARAIDSRICCFL